MRDRAHRHRPGLAAQRRLRRLLGRLDRFRAQPGDALVVCQRGSRRGGVDRRAGRRDRAPRARFRRQRGSRPRLLSGQPGRRLRRHRRGVPAGPGAVQLDGVAFPVLLAGQLAERATALPAGADAAIRRAATYLAQQGPVSDRDVDRWEENPGASPFTLGLEIVAMVVAAGHLTGADRDLALALADSWNERLEEFTYHAGSDLDREFGTSGHYVRIGLPGGDRVGVGNQPGGPLSIELRPPPWSAWSSSTCRGWTCGTHTTPVSPTRWPSSKRCSVAVRRMAPPTTATASTGTASGSTAAAGRGGTSASAAPGRCSPANAATTTYSPVATAAPS